MSEDLDEYQLGKILLIDKPYKWTSFDVVNKVRYLIKGRIGKRIKVGHAGTLDPLATGLLVICTGRFTKKLNELQADAKEYIGVISIGATTHSYDLETEVDQQYSIADITDASIHDVASEFLGELEQAPPVFSAKKINGVRSYKKARKGEKVVMKTNKVQISNFEVLGIIRQEDCIDVEVRIACSKGTYIRSIANDFGKALDSGAHLKSLLRTRSGKFRIEDALSMDEVEKAIAD